MKKLTIILSLLFFAFSYSFAENMEDLIRRGLKGRSPEFPKVSAGSFEELSKAAEKGDADAQKSLVANQLRYIRSVYKPLDGQNDLLVSLRKPEKGFDDAEHNYAVNLEEFFEETSDDVRIKKRDFEVQTKAGFSYPVGVLKYRPSDDAIEVKAGDGVDWISLTDLKDGDCCFVKNALADEIFGSSGGFEISSEDTRLDEIAKNEERGRVDSVHKETGERVSGSFESSSMDGISRKIVLENKGNLPLENLLIEYQSFVQQEVMRLPKDTPTDFRCVGCIQVKSLAPGERKEIRLDLPATVSAKQEIISGGDYEYYRPIKAGLNKKSEGRTNGIWVKVHRFTPYGERLTREYKSSGVPSAKWESVVPLSAGI